MFNKLSVIEKWTRISKIVGFFPYIHVLYIPKLFQVGF